MTRDDTLLLVITGGIACQLENLGSEVLQDGCEVDYIRRTLISVALDELVG